MGESLLSKPTPTTLKLQLYLTVFSNHIHETRALKTGALLLVLNIGHTSLQGTATANQIADDQYNLHGAFLSRPVENFDGPKLNPV